MDERLAAPYFVTFGAALGGAGIHKYIQGLSNTTCLTQVCSKVANDVAN